MSQMHIYHVEADIADHCNLGCKHCDHLAPHFKPGFYPFEEFKADLARLATVVHADYFYLLGGEPLLNSALAQYAEAVKRSGICDRVVLWTNGVLLPTFADRSYLKFIDRINISRYEGIDYAAVNVWAASCPVPIHDVHVPAMGDRTHLDHKSPSGVAADTYFGCQQRRDCYSLYRGAFYACPQAARVPAVVGEAQVDGCFLDDPDLWQRLKAYLNRTAPFLACHYCYGCASRVAKHEFLPMSHPAPSKVQNLPAVRPPGYAQAPVVPVVPPEVSADLTIVTTWYREEKSARAQELQRALAANCALGYPVVALCESVTPPIAPHGLQLRVFPRRPTYADAIRSVLPGSLVAIINTDCHFTAPIPLTPNLLAGVEAWALSRHEAGDPPKRVWGENSQDAWIFRMPLLPAQRSVLLNCDFFFGIRGCDHSIAGALQAAGFRVRNVGDDVKIIHLHASDVRNYGQEVTRKPWLLVPVTPIDWSKP